MKKSKRKISQRSLKRIVRRLDALLTAGQMCSNCCYNMANRERLDTFNPRALAESFKAWDAASLEIRRIMPR